VIIKGNKIVNEQKYSKRMASNIILDGILGDVPLDMEFNILSRIEEYRSTEYYDSKNTRISMLPSNYDVFTSLLVTVLSKEWIRPIQEVGTLLGMSLGIHHPVDAVKTGAEILAITEGQLFEITYDSEGTYVQSNFSLGKNIKKQLGRLQYLPPMKQKPIDWCNNHDGGWLWEKKSVLLGKNKHHNYKQALDVLNTLQGIAWEIDPTVLIEEENSNKTMDQKQFLRVAGEYIGQPFHFVWRFDTRGRSYSSGYDLNVQSNEYGKALLSLANKRKVTDLDNLKIAVANTAGHDKLTWDERIAWFDAQKDVFDTEGFDSPILGRKALRAYQDALEGKPVGYVMEIDATASGLQVMAMVSGCEKTATAVNCTHTGKREDIYQMVVDAMNAELNVEAHVDRGMVKPALMTHFYNSIANPKFIFSKKQLKVFYSVLEGLLPGAQDVMETINDFWDYGADKHQWTLPDGHVARVPITEMVDKRIEIDELDHRTFTYRYEERMPSENFRSLAPNIIHSIDGYVAREMVRRSDFELAHIHDCFLFHPNDLQNVLKLYREIMADIATKDVLGKILTDIAGEDIEVGKHFALASKVKQSEYMLS